MNNTNAVLANAAGPVQYGLTNDYMFRAVFQGSDEALRHLLSALLNIPVEEILSCEIMNPIILGDMIDEKTCILDIRLLLNHDRLINLEMQTGNFNFWSNRVLYYLSRLFCSLKPGEDYRKIKPALHIGILTGSPFTDIREFYSEYFMVNPSNGHIFSRNFSARMLDLSQIDSVPEEEQESELYYWARLFRATTWEEIRMLSEKKPYLNAAASNLRVLSEEEKIQLQCEARERYYLDMSSARSEGEEKGLKRGITQGTNLINQLNKLLLDDNRLDDLRRSTEDPDFQRKLLGEYGLVDQAE